MARERPLIVGIDELQWAEPTFLDLLEYLVGWTTDAPILVVGLSRPELLEHRPTWNATSSLVLPLDPLSGADSERLIDALGGQVDEEARDRILAGAEGNPLFVEQMRALAVEGAPSTAIPPSIHALLAARLDRLAEEERAVLERAAVIGREFTAGAVNSLSGDQPVGSMLLSLVRRDLIEPDRSLIPGDDGFRFRHILIRDAAYLGVAKVNRAELHRRYAEWLEGAAPDLDELVGYHLEQAFRYGQELGAADEALATGAGTRLARAGRRAVRRGDLPAATALLTRAAALLPDADSERREVLPILATALMRTGDFMRAEQLLDQALESARASGDKRLELRTIIDREFVRTFTHPGEPLEGMVAVADASIPMLEELGDELGLARAWWLKSEAHINACRWGARAADIERALEHAKRANDIGEEAALSALLAQALHYGPTPVPEAIERCEEMLAMPISDRSYQAGLRSTLGALRAMEGNFEDARSLWMEARTVYEELGLRRAARRPLPHRCGDRVAGREPRARPSRSSAGPVTSSRSSESRASEPRPPHSSPTRSARVGDFAEARRFADVAAESGAHDDVVTQVMWRIARSKADGDSQLAREAHTLAQTDRLSGSQGPRVHRARRTWPRHAGSTRPRATSPPPSSSWLAQTASS